MYAGDRHEEIGARDEYLFALAEQDRSRYPMLLRLWAVFYSEFVLTAEEGGVLMHELLDLYDRNREEAGKGLAAPVLRLATFMSAAARSQTPIRCAGD